MHVESELGINDYLISDGLIQVFNVLPRAQWYSVISVCKDWEKISLQCFKPKTLSALSQQWYVNTEAIW